MSARAKRIACIAFTRAGERLVNDVMATLMSGALAADLDEPWCHSVTGCYGEGHESLSAWTASHFSSDDALLFVGSTGIAVRAIAAHVHAKTSDPAVLVMDEGGHWVVSLLSGHIGGANRLATLVAAAAGATPVITTATDNRGLWAVDTWATRAGLSIPNPHAIKAVSGKLLAGGTVRVWADEGVRLDGAPPTRDHVLETLRGVRPHARLQRAHSRHARLGRPAARWPHAPRVACRGRTVGRRQPAPHIRERIRYGYG